MDASPYYNSGKIKDFYTITEIIIGKGSYAIVKLGYLNSSTFDGQTLKKVAVKIYNKTTLKKKQKKGNLDNEIIALKSLNHPNIIQLYEVFQDMTHIYLIMEYVEGESLLSFMKKCLHKRCSPEMSREIFKQILGGISYCHSKQICHRDLKLENILVEKSDQPPNAKTIKIPKIKIIDFGFASCYSAKEKGSVFCGTPSYMAPELILKQKYNYEMVDVWALGVLFYALITGLFPFKGASNKDMYNKIIKGSYVIPDRVQIGPKRLIMKMLQVNPEHRSCLRNITDKWLMGDEGKDNKRSKNSGSVERDQIPNCFQPSYVLPSSIPISAPKSDKEGKKEISFIKSYFNDEKVEMREKDGKLPPIQKPITHHTPQFKKSLKKVKIKSKNQNYQINNLKISYPCQAKIPNKSS